MEKLFDKDDFQRRDDIQRTKKELEKLETRKSNLQNDFMDRTITSQDYHDMKSRVEKELFQLKDKLTELQHKISPFKVYIQKEVPMLENLLEYYRKSDNTKKKKIFGCNSAKKLTFFKKKLQPSVEKCECESEF